MKTQLHKIGLFTMLIVFGLTFAVLAQLTLIKDIKTGSSSS